VAENIATGLIHRLRDWRGAVAHPAKANLPKNPVAAKHPPVKFSIVTPSFRNSAWLKLCIASVADQPGVECEHIVQDACSDDGTPDWLPRDPRVQAFIEKDGGMYDAINRGFRRATGDILAYLNCDEQYLPGALLAVGEFFAAHPDVEIVFADSIVVDAVGGYLCHRKVLVPLKYHSMVCTLGVLSCAMFFRRSVLEKYDLFFDPKWRDAGDLDWVLRALARHARMAVLRRFTSTFADTGDNMNLKPNARLETQLIFASAPPLAQKLAPAIKIYHRLRRLLRGIYFQKPFSYSIYTPASPERRTEVRVDKPTFIWKGRI
jgi:glycosyltransferase involved in cell wall biosynthesis